MDQVWGGTVSMVRRHDFSSAQDKEIKKRNDFVSTKQYEHPWERRNNIMIIYMYLHTYEKDIRLEVLVLF